jgi:hypothetical protein
MKKEILTVSNVMILLLLPCVLISSWAISTITSNDYSIPEEIRLTNAVSGSRSIADFDNLRNVDINSFLNEHYLDSCDWTSPESLLKDINTIEKDYPDNFDEYLIELTNQLTSKLDERLTSSSSLKNIDTLNTILSWSIKLHNCQEVLHGRSAKVFRIVSRHWMNKVANQLSILAQTDPSLKYSSGYKNLILNCQKCGVYPDIGLTNIEKISGHLVESNFGYLFNRFWNSTSSSYKSVVLLISLLFIYLTFNGLVHLFKKNSSND